MMTAASLAPLFFTLALMAQAPDGFALLRAGRTVEAREAFQASLRSNDQDADAWLGAGLVALRQERLLDARAFFTRALELAPGYAITRDTRSVAVFAVQVAGVPTIHVEEAFWLVEEILAEGAD